MSIKKVRGGLTDRILETARMTAVSVGREFSSNDGTLRLGGSICLMDPEDGRIFLQSFVGKPAPNKKGRFERNALNKCSAMLLHQSDSDCISSWKYRDPDAEPPVYGGRIELDEIGAYVACSGYTESVDEYFVLAIGSIYSFVSEARIEAILAVSGNDKSPFAAIKKHMMDTIAFRE